MGDLFDTGVSLWVALAAAVPGLLALVLAGVGLRRLSRLRRDQRVLTADGSPVGLVEGQASLRRSIDELARRLATAESRLAALDERIAGVADASLRRTGIARYDAFGDAGGHQSWSLALLDAERTGVVVTGLLGRAEARVYLKRLVRGEPDRELSDEESAAVARAIVATDAP